MKIVLLTDSLGFGGAQRQIVNLAACLKERGYEVSFIRYRNDDFYRPILEKAGIEPELVAHRWAVARMLKIRKAIRLASPDVVISFLTVPNFYVCMAAVGRHKWKTVISERLTDEDSFVNKKMKLLRMVQARYADKIVCNSKSAELLWKKYFPKVQSRVHTIYNIIEVPKIATSTKDDGKCRVVVAARYEGVKNLHGMLRAVTLLTDEERGKLEIHWYGKANVAEAAESVLGEGERFVKANKLDRCVFLHSATDKIYPIMAESDYVALFSFKEGLPNAIIEGMTLEKPVIMSKVSDYAVLVDEENGFLCDPNLPESIAEALRGAINTSRERREQMGQRSHEKIRKICSREVVIKQWEDLILN